MQYGENALNQLHYQRCSKYCNCVPICHYITYKCWCSSRLQQQNCSENFCYVGHGFSPCWLFLSQKTTLSGMGWERKRCQGSVVFRAGQATTLLVPISAHFCPFLHISAHFCPFLLIVSVWEGSFEQDGVRLMRGRGAKGQQFFVRTTSSASLTGRKEVKLARRSELMKNGHSYAINDLTNNWSNIVLTGESFLSTMHWDSSFQLVWGCTLTDYSNRLVLFNFQSLWSFPVKHNIEPKVGETSIATRFGHGCAIMWHAPWRNTGGKSAA